MPRARPRARARPAGRAGLPRQPAPPGRAPQGGGPHPHPAGGGGALAPPRPPQEAVGGRGAGDKVSFIALLMVIYFY